MATKLDIKPKITMNKNRRSPAKINKRLEFLNLDKLSNLSRKKRMIKVRELVEDIKKTIMNMKQEK